jgi:hypothetical protein
MVDGLIPSISLSLSDINAVCDNISLLLSTYRENITAQEMISDSHVFDELGVKLWNESVQRRNEMVSNENNEIVATLRYAAYQLLESSSDPDADAKS